MENPVIFNEEDRINYKNATHCHICEGALGMDKVRDHCHLTGEFRGAAHTDCNANFNYKNISIPIFSTA